MQKILIPIGAAANAVLTFTPSAAWAQGASYTDRYAHGPHMMEWGGGWYGMIFGPLIMILVLAVIVAATVLLVRWLGGSWPEVGSPPPPPSRTPLDILKERFARGEIDKEEYEEKRRILSE